jgi:hypothetical protein
MMPLAPLRTHPAPVPLQSDSYLTDGRRLFRVVSPFAATTEHAYASLEDCLTLEVRCYSPAELGEMRLRDVRTAQWRP